MESITTSPRVGVGYSGHEELGGAVRRSRRVILAREISEQVAHQRRSKPEREIVGVNRSATTRTRSRRRPTALIAPHPERGAPVRCSEDHRSSRDARRLREPWSVGEAVRDPVAALFSKIKDACRVGATVGEISDVFRAAAGEYRPH